VRVRHQQREAEAAQQPLGGAFPLPLVVAHLDQLAGEGQFVLADRQRRTQPVADADLGGVDVAPAPLKTFDLVGQGGVLFAPLAEGEVLLAFAVVEVGDALAQAFGALGDALLLGEKGGFIGWRRLVDAREQRCVAVGALLALVLLLLQTANFRRQFLQAVAAVVAQGPLQATDLDAFGLALRVQALDLGIEPGRILRQQAKAAVQQLALEPREVGPQRLAPVAPVLDLGHQRLVALTVLDQRRQQRDLALGLEHRLMGAVEVIEVADQRLDAAGHVEGLQHVAAHEVGEVAHRLHRHRLVEQLQRLLVLDAEAAAEPGAIGREAVEQLAARTAQLLAQRGDVAAEAAEVLGDGQCPLGGHEQARRLALRVLQPEHLGQRHRLVVALVAEHAEDDRVARRVAQRHRFGAARHLVALALVVAQHVGAQRALAGIRPGRLVVGHALRRHQQGGDGIDQRGLARTDVAGEQAVAAVER
jgi:hypothetical protein